MKQKNLLAVCAMSALLSAAPSAHAANFLDDIICDKNTNRTAKQAEEDRQEAVKKESRIVRDARGAPYSYSANLPTIHVGNFGLKFGTSVKSELGSAGKFVGADLWKLKTDFRIISAGSQVAFVRQYPNRDASFCRLPVNVFDLIPGRASDFKNPNGMKVGDLISFRTQLTLGMPGLSDGANGIKPPVAVTGSFEVRIFRMSKDLVRVRISGVDEVDGNLGATLGFWEIGPDLLNVRAIESKRAELLVWDYVFNFDETLENGSGQTAAQIYDQFIGSQIQIDLKNMLSVHFKNALENSKIVATGNINKSKNIRLVKQIEAIAQEDASKNQDQRRVIEVNRGGLKSSSMASGFEFNFLKLFRVISKQSEYQSLLWYADDKNSQSKFVLHGTTREATFKALKIRGASLNSDTALILTTTPDADFEQFTKASKSGTKYLAINHNDDPTIDFDEMNRVNSERFKDIELTGIYGIKATRSAEFKSINSTETSQVFAIMDAMLNTQDSKGKTNSIMDNMKWQTEEKGSVVVPNWEKFKKESHTNLKIRQDLMFKKELFEQKNLLPTTKINDGEGIVTAKVFDTLASLMKRGYKVNSTPVSSDKLQDSANLQCGQLINAYAGPYWNGKSGDGNNVDQSICFRNSGNYVRAYQEDAVKIGKYLAPILIEKNNHTLRYSAYRELIQIPLFLEIGGLVMMNIAESAVTAKGLNANLLKKHFVMRLTVESQGKPSHVGYYPDDIEYSRIDRLNQILSYQSYVSDRSYQLDQYMHPDGRYKTLDEILKALDISASPAPLIQRDR